MVVEVLETMRKVIIIGCFMAVFLLLMIPVGPTVAYQNQNDIINSAKETIDYSSVFKIAKQLSNFPESFDICDVLLIIFIFGLLFCVLAYALIAFPLAFGAYFKAKELNCYWTQSSNSSLLISTNNLCFCCESE